MPANVRQDILFYYAKGKSVEETLAAMQQDSAKGHGFGAAQDQTGISRRSIERVRAQWKKNGSAEPKVQKRRMPTLIPAQAEAITAFVDGQKRGYRIETLVQFLHFCFPDHIFAPSTVCNWLKYMGLTRKKGAVTPAQQCPHRIDQFWNLMQALKVRARDIVWADEMGIRVDRDIQLIFGYSVQGKTFRVTEKLGKGKRYDVLASMSVDGLLNATFYHKGTVQWSTFVTWCIDKTFPEMKRLSKTVFVIDNCQVRGPSPAQCRIDRLSLRFYAPALHRFTTLSPTRLSGLRSSMGSESFSWRRTGPKATPLKIFSAQVCDKELARSLPLCLVFWLICYYAQYQRRNYIVPYSQDCNGNAGRQPQGRQQRDLCARDATHISKFVRGFHPRVLLDEEGVDQYWVQGTVYEAPRHLPVAVERLQKLKLLIIVFALGVIYEDVLCGVQSLCCCPRLFLELAIILVRMNMKRHLFQCCLDCLRLSIVLDTQGLVIIDQRSSPKLQVLFLLVCAFRHAHLRIRLADTATGTQSARA